MENKGEIIIYQSADGQQKIDVRLENETICVFLCQELLPLSSRTAW